MNFLGYINKISTEKLNAFVIVYLDNLMIYSNKADHDNSIWWVIKQLRKHLLYAILKKCKFHQDEVQYLGYIVFSQEIYMKEE